MIQVKDIEILKSLLNIDYDPQLGDMLDDIEDEFKILIITCGYRKEDEGVHGTQPCRGLDLRSRIYEKPSQLAEKINERWEYDFKRPEMDCALYHARCPKCKRDYRKEFRTHCECGQNIIDYWHIHLQTHPNTRRRMISWV